MLGIDLGKKSCSVAGLDKAGRVGGVARQAARLGRRVWRPAGGLISSDVRPKGAARRSG